MHSDVVEKIKQFIEGHFAGLSGILMFLFYMIINQLPVFVPRLAKYNFPFIDAILMVLGTGFVIYDFTPKQVDYITYRFRHWLIQITDRLTPRYTFFIILVLLLFSGYTGLSYVCTTSKMEHYRSMDLDEQIAELKRAKDVIEGTAGRNCEATVT
ncbi:MAG: hypothetical protein U9N61_05430 [Euryarchaeota archaeon]|nr:hypothetical protein [Euryarchaeota archaeon]